MGDRGRFSFGKGPSPSNRKSPLGATRPSTQGSFFQSRLPSTQPRSLQPVRPSTSGVAIGQFGFAGSRLQRPSTAGAIGRNSFAGEGRGTSLYRRNFEGSEGNSFNQGSGSACGSAGAKAQKENRLGKERARVNEGEGEFDYLAEVEATDREDEEGRGENIEKDAGPGTVEILRHTLEQLQRVPDDLERERGDFAEELDIKGDEISALSEENHKLRENLEAANSELDEFSKQERERIERFEEIEGALATSTSTIGKLEEEIEELRKTIEQNQAEFDSNETSAEKKIAELKVAFEKEVMEAEEKSREMKTVGEELAYVRRKIEEQMDIARAMEAEKNSLERKLASAGEQKMAVEQALGQTQCAAERTKEELSKKTTELADIRNALEAEVVTITEKLMQAEEEHFCTTSKLQAEEARSEGLQKAVQGFEEANGEMQSKLSSLASIQPVLEQCRENMGTHIGAIETRMVGVFRKFERSIQRLKFVTEDDSRIADELQRLCSDYEESCRLAVSQSKEHEKEKAAEILAKYKAQVVELKKLLKASEVCRVNAEEAKSGNEESQARELSFMAIEHESVLADLNQRHEQAIKNATETERKLVAAHSLAKVDWDVKKQEEIASFSVLLEKTKVERDGLSKELSSCKSRLEAESAEVKEANATIECLKQELAQLHLSRESERASFETAAQEARVEAESQRIDLESKLEKAKDLERRMRAAEEKYVDVNGKIHEVSKQRDELETLAAASNGELEGVKKLLSDMEAKYETLTESGKSASALEKQHAASLQETNESLKQDVARLKSAIAETECNLRESAQLTMRAVSEKRSIEEQVAQIRKELVEEKLVVRNLKLALDQARRTNTDAQKEHDHIVTSPVLNDVSPVPYNSLSGDASRHICQPVAGEAIGTTFVLPPGAHSTFDAQPGKTLPGSCDTKNGNTTNPTLHTALPTVALDTPKSTEDAAKKNGSNAVYYCESNEEIGEKKLERRLPVAKPSLEGKHPREKKGRRAKKPVVSPLAATPEAGTTVGIAARPENGKHLTLAPRKAKRAGFKRPRGTVPPMDYGNLNEAPQKKQGRANRSKTAAATVIAAAATLEDDEDDWLVG